MNIYVGNLSHNTTEENIRQAFEPFGQVTSARIITDKYTLQLHKRPRVNRSSRLRTAIGLTC